MNKFKIMTIVGMRLNFKLGNVDLWLNEFREHKIFLKLNFFKEC